MNKNELADQLKARHEGFTQYLLTLSREQFVHQNNAKWTAGQELRHIILSVRPVRLGMMLPLWVLRLVYGTANRPSRTYDQLVARYKEKLSLGGTAPTMFVPGAVSEDKRGSLCALLKGEVDGLIRQLMRNSEEDLDRYLMGHPLLGKITLREMMYFTIYHVQHHQHNSRTNLGLGA